MSFIGLNIESKGCKPVELTKDEIKMIKRINGHTRQAVIYFIASVCFVLCAIALLFEGDDVIHFIFIFIAGLIFIKLFCSQIQQKIEYAYYGTVIKKELRYGMSCGRSTPTVTDYSNTVPQKTKEYCVKYEFVSVLIDGIKFENICCNRYFSKKIEVGSDVIIAKGYNINYEPTVYKR